MSGRVAPVPGLPLSCFAEWMCEYMIWVMWKLEGAAVPVFRELLCQQHA